MWHWSHLMTLLQGSSTTPCGWPSGTLNKLGVFAPRLGTIECKEAELMGLTTVFRWEYFVWTWTTHLLYLTYLNCFPKPKYYWDQKFLSPTLPQQQIKMKIWSQKPAACPSWYWFWFHDSLVTLGHILSISQEWSFSSFIKWCKLCKFKGNFDAWSPWSWAFSKTYYSSFSHLRLLSTAGNAKWAPSSPLRCKKQAGRPKFPLGLLI